MKTIPELDKTHVGESVAKTYITQLYEMVGSASSAKACGWEPDGLSIYVFDNEELGKCLSVRGVRALCSSALFSFTYSEGLLV